MADMTMTFDEEIDNWVRAVANMYSYVARETFDEQAARDAIQQLWSGVGFREAPDKVLEMLEQTLRAGYIAALVDVRAGKYDEQLRNWRSLH